MNGFRRSGRVLIGIVALAGFATSVLAQDVAPTLKGPEVKDNSIPGQKRSFGDGDKGAKGAARPLAMPAMNKALDVLRGENAGENKLSADQESQIKADFDAFRTTTVEYLDAHRAELTTLRSQLSPQDRARADQALNEGKNLRLGKNGIKGKDKPESKPAKSDSKQNKKNADAPEADPMMDPAENKVDAETSAKARARLAEILAGRPKPEDTQAKVFARLTEAQRKLVQEEIARLRQEMEKRAKDAKGAGAGSLVDELKGKSAEEIMNDPRVPERLRERLKNMTPEEREHAIKRLKESGLEGGRPARGEGKDKPAPKSSDVDVPAAPK